MNKINILKLLFSRGIVLILVAGCIKTWMIVAFFSNDTAPTEIYTLSLHDALPISASNVRPLSSSEIARWCTICAGLHFPGGDRKSTRLNSSHVERSYAVFCLK